MNYVGIDIGSTAAKVVVMDEAGEEVLFHYIQPTGWNSRETSQAIVSMLREKGFDEENNFMTATGYGRNAITEANAAITEITCHAKGALHLSGLDDLTVIDIGGQDTKIITIENGVVSDFIMNDKCSAGTGRFIEVMANSMGLTLDELFELAKEGKPVVISSLCTVFAESEVISLLGQGTPKADVAKGVLFSVIQKVVTQASRQRGKGDVFYLTGGFSNNGFVMEQLEERLGKSVQSHEMGRFAGAIGAALMGKKKHEKS